MYQFCSRYLVLILFAVILQTTACGKESSNTDRTVTQETSKEISTAKSEKDSAIDAQLLEATSEPSVDIRDAAPETLVAVKEALNEGGNEVLTAKLEATNVNAAESESPTLAKAVTVAPVAKLKESEVSEPERLPPVEDLSPAQEMLNLAQYKGKVIYLDFWASWCTPCKESFPWMQKMHLKYPDDLVIVAVNLDEKLELAEKFLASRDVDFKIVFDPMWQAGREYEIYGLPFSFVYNRQGELVGKHGGFTPGDDINLEAALNNLFALGE